MNKEITTFDDIKIGKCKFYYFKYSININNADYNKIVILDKLFLV